MRTLLIIANVAAPAGWLASGFAWPALLAMFAVHMLTLYATLAPGCAWLGEVQTRLAEGETGVWITIDDGPDREFTRAAMDLLEDKGARATFFLIGERAAADPELVREIASRGHGVGNHTRSHPAGAFWRLGPRRLAREIAGGGEQLADILGTAPTLFRAPAGMRNPFVHPILRRLGLRLVGWSARGFDGRVRDVDRIVARITRRLVPGAIVLLHEGRRTNSGESLLMQTLPRVLEEIRQRGLLIAAPPAVD